MTINKRVAISFITIVGVMSLVVALTIAQFTDQAQLTGNTFSTGSGDLLISDDFEASCVLESFSPDIVGISEPTADLAPGQSVSKNFCLLNDSDSDIALEVTAAVDNVSGSLDQTKVDLTIACDGNDPLVGTLDSFSGTVILSLAQSAQVDCTITAGLSETADNDQADKTISFDVIFTGTQI